MVNKFFDLLDQFDQVDKWLNSSSNCFDSNHNVPEFPVVVLLPIQCFNVLAGEIILERSTKAY